MASVDLDSLRRQIPFYLTAEDQKVLVEELKALSEGASRGYTLHPSRDQFTNEMLQGDGWTAFQLFMVEAGERRAVRGLVLSNSCDIDPVNHRDVPARVLFAPLVKLSAFEALLRLSGIASEKIEAKLSAIRSQRVSNFFYIPAGHHAQEEYVVRFDEAQSMPLSVHADTERQKLFTLSNTGFYMLVFKLSVHFCRLQERVQRGFA